MIVKNLRIREVFATTTEKTIEVELETKKGIVRSSIPIGTSRGKYEVKFLPVENVIKKFLMIRRRFTGEEIRTQEEVDSLLRMIDKTQDLREIGGNLALAISSVFLKALAFENDMEVFEFLSKGKTTIPKPICNVAGGWKESGKSDVQEYLFLPVHQKSFLDSVTKIANAYRQTASMLVQKDPNFAFSKNLESAWVTKLDIESTLKILDRVATENLLKIGLDFAASQLWNGNEYVYSNSGLKLSRTEQISFVEDLTKRYPISYVEDPFHEDDFVSFSTLTHRIEPRIVCGDDLYATNLERLKLGIRNKASNGIVIKPSQVGTISDTIKVVNEAKKNKMITIMSHRSGETEDTLICHLAVGLGCEYVKFGISGERTVKINEMLRIEEKLKK
ncbi:MAG: hypothetical protein QMD12_01445 [Candidatus Aenigmarchaeota archaeon]|nr:hypothetical protein [Candidatus Aenigmarchaeota archaeon]